MAPAFASAAAPCDRFASPTGDDRDAGTVSAPLRTPQGLADTLGPGETGCLADGTYTGTGPDGFVLYFEHGGRRGAPLTIRSAPGARAELHGTLFVAKGSNDVRLSHLTINAQRPRDPLGGQVGIAVMASRTALVDNRITSSRARSCVLLGSNADLGGARRTVIRGNVFRDCGDYSNGMLDHAIYASESTRAKIVDNVFVGSAGYAIQLYPNAQHSLVRNNVMYGNGGGVIFGGEHGLASSHNVVVDNVIAQSRVAPEVSGWFDGKQGRRNVARSNCLVPGKADIGDDSRGFRAVANRVGSAPTCLATVSKAPLGQLAAVVPAIASLPAIGSLLG